MSVFAFNAANVTAVGASDDSNIVTIRFKSGDGEIQDVRVQLEVLLQAASFAQKERMRRANVDQFGPEGAKAGSWVLAAVAAPTNWAVGFSPMLEPPCVTLAFDAGTKWENAYRFRASDAVAIGQKLIDQAKKLTAPMPTPH